MLELNKIYCGKAEELLLEIDGNSIPLTVTSPPYFAYKDYGDDKDNLENCITYEEYINRMNIIFKELYRVTSEDGRLCVIIDDKHTNLKTEGINKNRGTHARFILMAEELGFIYKDLIIWAKARVGHASGGANYMLGSFPFPPNIPMVNWFEYILIFRKDGQSRVQNISEEIKEQSKLGFNEFKWASESIWKIPAEKNRIHPCPFPEEIPRRLIKLFSFEGEIVLDPFCGWGTTSWVAKQLNRNFIGFEINPEYVKIANKRLEQSSIREWQD